MTFLPAVPGQELAKRYFWRALELGRLSHAYVFLGPEGAGKRLFARELAKAFLCDARTACGECLPCRKVSHGNHPAVEIYGPVEGKTVIDIDTVRALCSRAHYKSQHIQIGVLERAELLSEPAANALLKTLEEPPGEFLLILTAQSAGTLLSTIVSRCHRIFFTATPSLAGPGDAETDDWLQEPRRSGFFARWDLRDWLTSGVPEDAGTLRQRVRYLLDRLLADGRRELRAPGQPPGERRLRALGRLLDLREDLDRNVHPDLVLERVVTELRRPG